MIRFLALTMLSFSAFANCPNLAGNYTCTIDLGNTTYTSEITVTQTLNGNHTVYTHLDHSDNMTTILAADEQTYTFPSPEGVTTMKASCLANLLQLEGTFQGFDGTNLIFKSIYSILNPTQVEISTTSVFESDLHTVREVCTRK